MTSNINEMKENAQAIKQGLAMMGRERRIALSVHKTLELIDDLEVRADKLVKAISSMEK